MPEIIERIEPQFDSGLEIPLGDNPGLAVVALVGLGYVGLPVAVAFGRHRTTIGYDLSKKRVENLRHLVDPTGEVSSAQLTEAKYFRATTHAGDLAHADFIIVAVPTPINAARQPDFSPARVREPDRRALHEARRHRDLRVHRVSGRHRGSVRADPGEVLGHALAPGFPRRLLARAHQPGRQGALLHARS